MNSPQFHQQLLVIVTSTTAMMAKAKTNSERTAKAKPRAACSTNVDDSITSSGSGDVDGKTFITAIHYATRRSEKATKNDSNGQWLRRSRTEEGGNEMKHAVPLMGRRHTHTHSPKQLFIYAESIDLNCSTTTENYTRNMG